MAGLNFVSLAILLHFFGPKVSFSIAYLVALTAHFTLSKFWTFRDQSRAWSRQILQYLGGAFISYVIQLWMFQSCMSLLGLGAFAANAIAVCGGAVVGFLLMQIWIFKHQKYIPDRRREETHVTTPPHDPRA